MRYIIGIDLGTTNSCVAYLDMSDPSSRVHSLKIPQLVAEGRVESLGALPSFCYLAASYEWPKGALDLPWHSNPNFFVGSFALTQGAKVPTRLVSSAKSWLCHPAANRRDKILPLDPADENSRISPVEATSRYLRHIREAWNAVMAKGDVDAEFDSQEIVLTVPASFDEAARSLTVEAARMAGFVQMTLLEEPQAAFYSWITQHEERWNKHVFPGAVILVCDIGGGTSDFSLIEVGLKNNELSFQRMAVGDHLLLGGDNMDAAIARFVESKMEEKGVIADWKQRQLLLHEARQAKEKLLQQETNEASYSIVLHGAGSSVVSGSAAVTTTTQEIRSLLLDGFFGQYSWEEALKLRRTAGIRSMGLPYEDDPSITKHLARFLAMSDFTPESSKQPNFVLFNGGAVKPIAFQNAVLSVLSSWFPKPISLLDSYNLDLAVARGAAYFGKARHGLGMKISGGIARGYYLIIDTLNARGNIEKKALTLVSRGSEEGYVYEPDMVFQLIPNAAVSFQLCSSHTRLGDLSGDLVDIDDQQMSTLPPIQTILRFGKKQGHLMQEKIPVHLRVELTPIGTLAISLKALKTDHRWNLEFQVRSATGQENSLAALIKREEGETFQEGYLHEAEKVVDQIFGLKRSGIKPGLLIEQLEKVLGAPRKEWPSSVMRSLADKLIERSASRKISSEYGERWWNIVGFLMRPGFGYPMDDFRLKELWKVILSDFNAALSPEVQIQRWICYRRIAGGLNKGQQTQIANDLVGMILSKKTAQIEIKSKSDLHAYAEKVRAFGSLELIDTSLKIRVGNALVSRITRGDAISADYWALGRLGARHLLYGSLVNVIPAGICEHWIGLLLEMSNDKREFMLSLLGQLARKTEYRDINLSSACIEAILSKLSLTSDEPLHELLTEEIRLTRQEQEQAFGDTLPSGLLLQLETP